MKYFALILGLVAASAHAEAAALSYNIDFNTSIGFGEAPTSGRFTYDTVLQVFTDFDVVWNGFVFDLTTGANDPSTSGALCFGSAPRAQVVFTEVLTTGGGTCGFISGWYATRTDTGIATFGFNGQNGNIFVIFTAQLTTAPLPSGEVRFGSGDFTTVAVPEPVTAWLIVAGGGILATRRRRYSPKNCRTFPQ